MTPLYFSTRGIVFSQVKYSDTSLIVKIFTEAFGLVSYLVKGARNPRSKIRAGLFQPLTLLDLVVTNKSKHDLHHLREARLAFTYQTIPFDIRKTTILVFIDELLCKSVREEEANRELFAFIEGMLMKLDALEGNFAHFHLYFTIQLTRHLGLFPHGNYQGPASHFNLPEGRFSEAPCLPGPDIVDGPACHYLDRLMHATWNDYGRLSASPEVRNDLQDRLLRYYRYHLSIPGEFKAHLVLREVLRG